MSDQVAGKLNHLLAKTSDTRLISSCWLRSHGYTSSLVARYVSSGWLVSPVRGVYLRKGGRVRWEGVVRSLQIGEDLPLHVGGRFSLALQGHEHYLRLGEAGTITLYGPDRPPSRLGKLALAQEFNYAGKGPFDLPSLSFAEHSSDKALSGQGLAWYQAAEGTDAVVCSTPERAMLELCDGIVDATLVYEADALMQAMTTLRPQRVGMLLRHCAASRPSGFFLPWPNVTSTRGSRMCRWRVSIWARANAPWCLAAACIQPIRSPCRETSMNTWLDQWDRRYTDRVRLLFEILSVLAQEPSFGVMERTAINFFDMNLV